MKHFVDHGEACRRGAGRAWKSMSPPKISAICMATASGTSASSVACEERRADLAGAHGDLRRQRGGLLDRHEAFAVALEAEQRVAAGDEAQRAEVAVLARLRLDDHAGTQLAQRLGLAVFGGEAVRVGGIDAHAGRAAPRACRRARDGPRGRRVRLRRRRRPAQRGIRRAIRTTVARAMAAGDGSSTDPVATTAIIHPAAAAATARRPFRSRGRIA